MISFAFKKINFGFNVQNTLVIKDKLKIEKAVRKLLEWHREMMNKLD
jgi:hypothetical protein